MLLFIYRIVSIDVFILPVAQRRTKCIRILVVDLLQEGVPLVVEILDGALRFFTKNVQTWLYSSYISKHEE